MTLKLKSEGSLLIALAFSVMGSWELMSVAVGFAVVYALFDVAAALREKIISMS